MKRCIHTDSDYITVIAQCVYIARDCAVLWSAGSSLTAAAGWKEGFAYRILSPHVGKETRITSLTFYRSVTKIHASEPWSKLRDESTRNKLHKVRPCGSTTCEHSGVIPRLSVDERTLRKPVGEGLCGMRFLGVVTVFRQDPSTLNPALPQHHHPLWRLSSLSLSPAVCKSIQEPVTKDILLEYVDRCAQGVQAQNRKHPPDPDSELMPPPPPKRPNRAVP